MKVLLNYRSKYDLKLSSAKNNLFIPSLIGSVSLPLCK